MRIGEKGAALIKSFEGCRLEAYPDPGTGGDPWTIGWGHTGPEVGPGLSISQQEADAYFVADVAKFERCVTGALLVDITQDQFDALCSFAYNVGCSAMAGSTLVKLLNNGDVEGAAQQFGRWNKAGGRAMAGLTRRREAERALFQGGA